MLVREQRDRDEPGQLQHVHGEQHHLERHSIASGVVQLGDALAYWWVLDDDHRARRREATIWGSTGHVAAVHGDELYDILAQTRGGYGRLQDFGIRFGYERVVLHLQPQVEASRLECNTARTLLLLDHEPLPWARWGEEFTASMPAEIRQLQERAASTDMVPRREAIRNRVNAILPLYQLSSYRPTPPPRQTATQSTKAAGDDPTDTPARPRPPTGQPCPDGAGGPPSRERAHEEPPPNRPIEDAHDQASPHRIVSLPDVAWISARDGSRAPRDLEDEAARYHPGRHELTINADFRAITDLITHWQDRYRGIPGARGVIEAQVREWCEQILVEVVLAARSSTWSAEQLHALLSPTSFTAALLPRHLLHSMLQKRLAQKLGTSRHESDRSTAVIGSSATPVETC